MSWSLSEELAELEREDPVVRAAAASYDRMVDHLLYGPRQCKAASLTHGRRRCRRDEGHAGFHLHDDGNGVTAWGGRSP